MKNKIDNAIKQENELQNDIMKMAEDILHNPPTEEQRKMKSDLDEEANVVLAQQVEIMKLNNELAWEKRFRKIDKEEFKRMNEKIKRLEHEKHVYKLELGKCQRKLFRLYQFLKTWHYHFHTDESLPDQDRIKDTGIFVAYIRKEV